MAEDFKKLAAGDFFNPSAKFINEIIDTVLARRNERQGGDSAKLFRQTGIIRVKNDSGSAVGRFGILGIDAPLITPSANADEFKRGVALSGITPADASHWGKFVVLREPLDDGAIGDAFISGACAVQVDFQRSDDPAADIKDGDTTSLQGGTVGTARVLWKESGTGVKWAVVLLGANERYPAVKVKVTGSATRYGCYTGRLLWPPASLVVDGSGTLAETDLGTVPGADDTLILNSREVGQSTHDLANSGYLPLVFIGDYLGVNADGKHVVVIDGYQWKLCTPPA